MGKAFISPAPTPRRGGRSRRLGVVENGLLALGIAAGAWIIPAGAADLPEVGYVIPGSKAAGLENCVRETPFMRRNHMELIEHQRDETVHRGIRKTDASLAGCIDCHVGRNQQGHPISVYAEGQFCRTCHELAAVKINCFDCHATVPVPPGAKTAKTPKAAETKTPRITPKVE